MSTTCSHYNGLVHHGLTAQNEEYWKSPKGIASRISSLAQVFNYGVYNGAVKILGTTKGVQWMKWETAYDDRVCPVCLEAAAGGSGEFPGYYRSGWFTPAMPAHAGCRCQWVLYWKDEKTLLDYDLDFVTIPKADRPIFVKDEMAKKTKSAPRKWVKIKDLKKTRIGGELTGTDILLINKPKEDVVNAVTEVLKKWIPFKWHNRGLREIRIINAAPRSWVKGIRKGRTKGYLSRRPITGGFNTEIVVYAKNPTITRTLMHEVGHNFYYNHMNEDERSSWSFLFSRLKDYEMPSDYAETSAEELFAESYACLYSPHRGRDFLSRKITDWIDNHDDLKWLLERPPEE